MNPYEQLEQRFAAQEHELRVHQVELEQQNEELRQVNLELELARNRYADLFEFAPVGYVVCDGAGVIRQINATGCAQLGSDCGRLVGRPFALFVEAGQRQGFAELLRQIRPTPQTPSSQAPSSQVHSPQAHAGPRRLDIGMLRPDGGRWDAQLECTALQDVDGLLTRLVLTDINELKTAQREAERQHEQVRRLNEELQTFLRAMTHDLTRPQRQVEGFAALLSKSLDADDARSAAHLRHLLSAASDMGALTTALTRFYQSGQPEAGHQPVNLNHLIDVIRHELEPETRGRQVSLTRDALPTLLADRPGLHLIFFNLLANAVKFTRTRPEARIHVGVQRSGAHHLLSVRDNGVGFDPRQASRLFGLFERLHSDREYHGLGLGLALVRRIVERQGGRVWAEGAVGEGATFWVDLPAEAG